MRAAQEPVEKFSRYVIIPFTTGLACFAEGLWPSAKAQKPSAKALPRAAVGKGPSGNF
jgi:hypothetical protein